MLSILVAYMSRLLRMIINKPITKKAAVNKKALDAPISNQTLCENGMLTSMNTSEKNAVNVTVAIS